MSIQTISPRKALNKAYLKAKPLRDDIDTFKQNFTRLLNHTNDQESEEFHKNLVADFLKNTWYAPDNFINTKGRNDLVIHNGKDAKSSVGVIIEAKKTTNKAEMLQTDRFNVKAMQELVLYYLRERITNNNLAVKHLIATNIREWYIFDAREFEKYFAQDKTLVRQFHDFNNGRLADTSTDFFYKQIAAPAIEAVKEKLTATWFDLRSYSKALADDPPRQEEKRLVALYKVLSPEHLLKLPFANDSNQLDKRFYNELLHIIGLKQVTKKGKKLIERKAEGERDPGSLLENAIMQLDTLNKINRMEDASGYGENNQERLFNVGLELCITWINRILFLKLLEAQLLRYHKGDPAYAFMHGKKIKTFGDLNRLFFSVLAKKPADRNEYVKQDFEHIPYLNSSLFEVSEIEDKSLLVNNLNTELPIPLSPATVLKDTRGRRIKGEKNTLEYLFSFLDAYDFSSEGSEDIQEGNKTLINASVLGLIFEKINGYKEGSFFTPGFITMYMCRETIRRAVLQKFKEAKGWDCSDLDALYDKIEDRSEANRIVNSLKICDPAVGSGHFLVSALNEIIAIKSELRILQDRAGRRLKEYSLEVENDDLIITDEQDKPFEYRPGSKESQRVQEALFHEKQTLIENCLFGVDINPNSVKICRLRLWIELLKNAYYKENGELETLPNIDINIKCGNSLVSRFSLDADLRKALKSSKWSIEDYRVAVQSYRSAETGEEKWIMKRLIRDIKSSFRAEISNNDPKVIRLAKLKGELFNLTNQGELFDRSKKEQDVWNQKLAKLTNEITKLETEIEEIKNNKIYDNAFEWRFEFPEVLNDDGDFVGFDVVIGNPPYIQLSKTDNITKEYKKYLIETYQTSGGRLNTFIFFIHLSNKILHFNGLLNFIVPNTILSQEYYAFTRDFLVNKVSLTEVVNFQTLPFEDAVVETVLIQYVNKPNLVNHIQIKELSKEKAKSISDLKKETIKRDSKYSFVYQLDPVIEKVFEKEHSTFGSICDINQGIALRGSKALSLKDTKDNDECYKLLDGRNINKYSVKWDGVWLDYDLDRIHSCKRKDIFKSAEKLLFRRVSSSLMFAYDDEQFFALNTLVIVNKKNPPKGPNLKFILGLMNSQLMNYVYNNKYKSTKTVFSEIQARSVKQLPIPFVTAIEENEIKTLVDEVIDLKNSDLNTTKLENQIDQLVYQLYDLTEEDIQIIENSLKP
jgi:adenine-specific DNA-methyltransferase